MGGLPGPPYPPGRGAARPPRDRPGPRPCAATGEALTDVTRASIEAALAVALRKVSAELRGPLPTRFAVIAMGRFGGHEVGYGSDADVLFVHDPLPGRPEKEASDAAHTVAVELRRLLMLPVPDPALVVDADLRPEGRQGRWCARWPPTAPSSGAGRRHGRRRRCCAPSRRGDVDLGARFSRMIAEFR